MLAPGDLNLTFNRYVETPVTLHDRATITSSTSTARASTPSCSVSYLAAFGDRESYATSHRRLGHEPVRAVGLRRAIYDTREMWGTEARAFAGNFLYSTGANENAGRFTAGHFDLPMRGCTVRSTTGWSSRVVSS